MILPIHSFLTDIFAERKPSSVLDLGAGEGLFSIYAASFEAHVTAVDLKPFPEYLHGHPLIKTINQDIGSWISQNKQTFDCIIVRSVLHYFAPEFVQTNLLPKLAESTIPGGVIYIGTMTPDESAGKFFHDPETIATAIAPLTLVSKDEVVTGDSGKKHIFYHLVFQK
ncbi:MAG TPA: class I SAM-dependent methyltransferase [Candidatus Paceibacterota bacterium]|nr:class I SAM-dependent methyltransferase [Candidatus Paceibacterota bacterium]